MTDLPHPLTRSLVIRAPLAVVFRFFTDSERFARWWGPGSTIDGRLGGAVRIVYPNGIVAGGTITRFEPDRRLTFTFGYEDPARGLPVGGSLVTIELTTTADGTRLDLRHDLPEQQQRDQHVPGWRFQLALFANVAADEAHAALATTTATWFAAWNHPDDAERARLVATCCAAEVSLQDRYSCLTGVADLLDHMRMSRRFQPGITIRASSAPRHNQGTAVVDWVLTDATGAEQGRGSNVFRLTPDGRIAGVVGLWG